MSPRPLLPFTPSTKFSHRDIEQRVGPRSPRTPRLDAVFSAVPMRGVVLPMRGVVLPGRFSVGPRDFSRFEHMSAWNTAAQRPAPHRARSPAPAQARGGLPAPDRLGQPSGRDGPGAWPVLSTAHVHELLTPGHRYISESYVGRQLPGAAVSFASRQSGLSVFG